MCITYNLCPLLIVKNKHMKIQRNNGLLPRDQFLNLSTTELNSDGTRHPRWDMVRWALLKTKSDSDRASRMILAILAVPGTLIIPQSVSIICPSNAHQMAGSDAQAKPVEAGFGVDIQKGSGWTVRVHTFVPTFRRTSRFSNLGHPIKRIWR